jgi:hypothetical protein
LVVAWAAGVFFGLRWLWRQVKALMEATSQAAAAAESALDAQNSDFEPAPVPAPALHASPEDLIGRLQASWDRKAARRRRRQERDQAAYDAWAVLAGWRDPEPDNPADPADPFDPADPLFPSDPLFPADAASSTGPFFPADAAGPKRAS